MTMTRQPRPMIAHTLESLHAHCEEIGDCWEWQRTATFGRYPNTRHKGKTVAVRRLVLELSGIALKPKSHVITTCGCDLCINPEHLQQVTQHISMKRAGAKGRLSDPVRSAKIAATKRASPIAKLDMETVRQIRASSETTVALAARYGVSQSKISAIQHHRAWREFRNNPFAGLGARRAA